MANRLEFSATMDNSGFRAGIVEMERLAATARVRMENTLGTGSGRNLLLDAENARQIALNRNRMESGITAERELAAAEVAIAAAAAQKKADVNKAAWLGGQAEWRTIQGAQVAEMLAGFEKQRIATAALRVEQLAMLTQVARSGGLGSALFGGHIGGGGGGGISGIMRETLVIFRELGRGNFTRIPGSVSLLAQYMGVLGILVKSTAQDAIKAAAAENTLAASMARAALVAEAKYRASIRSAEGDGLSAAAAEEAALAYRIEAEAAREAALAQSAKAARAIEGAEIESAAATVTLGPLGWLAAALVAVGAAAYFVWKHFKNLADSEAILKKWSDTTSVSFVEKAEGMRRAAQAAAKYADEVAKIMSAERELGKVLDQNLSLLRERHRMEMQLAEAKGMDKRRLAELELQQLREELQLLEANAKALQNKVSADKAESDAAQAALKPSEEIQSKQAAKGAQRYLDIIAALEEKRTTDSALEYLQGLKKGDANGGSSPITFQEDLAFGAKGGIALRNGENINSAIARYVGYLNQTSEWVNVDGKKVHVSMNDAQKEYERLSKLADTLAADQEHLKDLAARKLKGLEVDEGDLKKTQDEVNKLKGELGIKEEFLPEIARASGRGGINPSDSLVKVGNFLGSARGKIETLAYDHLQVAKQTLEVTRHMNEHLGLIASKATTANFSTGSAYPVN